jgi:NRAMP (natural resistance-associated macrophage protein)-like metal ion transporter
VSDPVALPSHRAGGPSRPTRLRVVAVVAVLGPGLLAGLSDDDPAGITTYSVLGAEHGYQLLWVLLLSTVALIVFHDLGARLGVVTGQGMIGLVRQRYGVRVGAVSLLLLVVANVGTSAAELAGVAAGSELLGIDRVVAVPVAAAAVTALVLAGSFHRVEHLLMALAAVFVAYVGAGLFAGPDWGAALHGTLVPQLPGGAASAFLVAATVGTTLAPWGLSFIQSYAADKRLTVRDLGYERVDVVVGATLTGVIGFFVVVACAETLHARGLAIHDAADAARALEPVAGHLAGDLFAVGLLGAALLAAAVVPLSTAYSVCDLTGSAAALDRPFREAPVFYLSHVAVVVVSVGIVLLPGVPLVRLLLWTQTLNAVLLLPLLVVLHRISTSDSTVGRFTSGRGARLAQLAVITGVAASVVLLLV